MIRLFISVPSGVGRILAEQRAARHSSGRGKMQVRILQTLAKTKQPITKQEIATKAEINPAMTYALGPEDDKKRAKNDKKYGKSLVSRRFAKATDKDGAPVYS